ncbi:homoserine O-acetyltransferase MetA [Flexilinea flocculi]|jgi:homoserine O-succinyltransferase|uniref:Homoserine O-acetyltransferase n=1 Tax=Flexilinea flocculi TaxID=1678840 RepID=A0A0S7BJD2_9CHLR|nr:homoserine O-succinyltransferase [Flexilinea flocculi]NMB93067.1 homoserine O-succinyltransferase [Flexilinea flocculi]GAP40444.1 homoserine O-succinyltransferase [Flexilinea flocculi]
MPITIPDNHPAAERLENENIFVMNGQRAIHQDIRPLKILILNLMPTKMETEVQLLRLLSNTPLQVDIEFLQAATHVSKNTSPEYLNLFYKSFDQVSGNKFDGFIITGAPVENMPFEAVDYWDELCMLMDWSRVNVYSTLHICWGAQAALYHHYGINKYPRQSKISGIYTHRPIVNNHPLMRGFDEIFYMPHSRYTEVRQSDIESCPDLEILAISDIAGVAISASKDGRQFFIQGHTEYDRLTLAKEYERDVKLGLNPDIPENYYPGNSPKAVPMMYWRSHANLLFSNWLNYYVYQQTPYDITAIH